MNAARSGDMTAGICDDGHKCCPHWRHGQCAECSENVFINGAGAFRRGDRGSCGCRHGGEFLGRGGSTTVFVNGKAAMRAGEMTKCEDCGHFGEIQDGSPNVFIGG